MKQYEVWITLDDRSVLVGTFTTWDAAEHYADECSWYSNNGITIIRTVGR